MKILQTILIFILIVSTFSVELVQKAGINENYTSFMFGSCNQKKGDSQIFEKMGQQDSQVFLWLGDFAYVNKIAILGANISPNSKEVANLKFQETYNDPYYKQFRQSGRKILGIYDDHDLNLNNSDKNNPNKEWVKEMFLDYIEEPQDSPRRKNPYGIYESYYLGDTRSKLILLDIRYNRDPEIGDTLGKPQWQWLEKELQDEKPYIFFITSGVQFLPDDRLTETIFLESKNRLLKLIKKYRKKVILLSGDIHSGEILYQPCSKEYLGYELTEITSSGLNLKYHPYNRIVMRSVTAALFTDTFSTEKDRMLFKENYGKIDIHWSQENIEDSYVSLQLFDKEYTDRPRIFKNISFRELDIQNNNNIDSNSEFQCEYLEKTGKNRFHSSVLKKLMKGNKTLIVMLILALQLLSLFIFIVYTIYKKIFKRIKSQNQNNNNLKQVKQD